MESGENGSDNEMHRDVSWMTPADRPILQELADVGGRWQKPATLALNMPYSRYHIADRLRTLADHQLVERKSDNIAAYRITDRGRAFLAAEIDVRDLQTVTDSSENEGSG